MTSGEADPWSGDDIPVASGLGEIVWDAPAEDSHEQPASADEHRSARRFLIPIVAIGSLALILAAVFAWPDRGAPTAEQPEASAPAAPTTLGTLPPASTTTTTTTTEPADDVTGNAQGQAPEITQLPVGDLPPAVAASQVSTDVVVVTGEGELVTLSLPSGEVTERIDLGFGNANQFNGGSLVLSPDGAAYSAGGDFVVVPVGGTATSIDRSEFSGVSEATVGQLIAFGWTTNLDGANVFVVISFDQNGQQSEWLVTNTGEVSPAPAQRLGSFARPLYAMGTRFIDDAGGTYRIDPNGDSTRVSNGQLLGMSDTRLLLRECDASRNCTNVLRDYDGLEVRIVDLPATYQPGFFAASISPDDTAVTDLDFDGERTIIDLDSGETTTFPEQWDEFPIPNWSADGAGVFTPGGSDGILFLDRATGEGFSFATDLGSIRALATRSPTEGS